MHSRNVAQKTEERTVRIVEVNTQTGDIFVRDQFNTSLALAIQYQAAILSIPKVGEWWTVQRQGNDWFLDKKAVTGSETTLVSDMQPGDKRIDATGSSIHMNAQSMMMNGVRWMFGTGPPPPFQDTPTPTKPPVVNADGTRINYQVGDLVWNTIPAASGYVGWVCVTAGSPGTWKGFGAIAA